MKKTISLILSMFLLLSSCGKIKELMNPTSDTSAQAKAAAEAQAKAAAQVAAEKAAIEKVEAEAQAKAAIEPEIKTPSESEKKSEETKEITAKSETESKETTEKQQEENEEELTVESSKLSRFVWWTAKKTVQVAGVAVVAYGLYRLWNRIMNPKPIEEPKENEEETQQAETFYQQAEAFYQQASDDDEYSQDTSTVKLFIIDFKGFKEEGDGIDYEIYNEFRRLEGHSNWQEENIVHPGKGMRLVSKTGRIVKIDHEAQYKAKWEVYKREHYPNHNFD